MIMYNLDEWFMALNGDLQELQQQVIAKYLESNGAEDFKKWCDALQPLSSSDIFKELIQGLVIYLAVENDSSVTDVYRSLKESNTIEYATVHCVLTDLATLGRIQVRYNTMQGDYLYSK